MKRIALLLVCSLTSPLAALAQNVALTSPPNPATLKRERAKEEKQNQIDERRARAVSLIEQTALEAPLWQEPESIVTALTESADLLWEENPKASLWLSKAWDSIGRIEDRENPDELKQIWRGSQRSRMRTIVLAVALKRDAQLANRFLQALEPTELSANNDHERGAFDDRSARSEQLLRLAASAIDTNPTLALSLANRSLQEGISFNLQTILLQLRLKDARLANQLFDSALARLTSSSAAFAENQILASYLFRPGQVVARLPDGSLTVGIVQTKLAEQTPAQSDPVRARNFLAVAQRILLSEPLPTVEQSKTAGEFVLLADSLAQPFLTYAPDLWQPVAVRRGQFASLLSPSTARSSSGISEKVRDAAKNGAPAAEVNRLRVEALEEAAENERDPIARKFKFAEAALATLPQSFERGKQLAGKIDHDDDLRDRITTFLDYRAALSFFNENRLEKSEEIASRMPLSLEKALVLIAVAQKLAKLRPDAPEPGSADVDQQHALELLFDADKSLKNEAASANIVKVRLGKISISQLLDSSQALIDFEQAIAVINRLERFDPTDEASPRLGIEGFGTAKFTVPTLNLGFGFRSALEPLIKDNFEATIATIDRLNSPSVRGICRLLAARQVLNSLPKPHQTKTPRSQKTVGLVRPGQ